MLRPCHYSDAAGYRSRILTVPYCAIPVGAGLRSTTQSLWPAGTCGASPCVSSIPRPVQGASLWSFRAGSASHRADDFNPEFSGSGDECITGTGRFLYRSSCTPAVSPVTRALSESLVKAFGDLARKPDRARNETDNLSSDYRTVPRPPQGGAGWPPARQTAPSLVGMLLLALVLTLNTNH